MFILTAINLNTSGPVIFGLSFLEKEPNAFECRVTDSNGQKVWKECDKEYICEKELAKEDYRPIEDDETFDNWVERMDMLCENEFKIGLIGSMYFVGVVLSTITAPPLADAYGRKLVVLGSNILRIIGLTGLIITDSLYAVYVFEVFVGFSFAGLVIVAISYMLEF